MTPDEKLYLCALCDGSKDPHEPADVLATDPTVSKAHRPETVADRLAYLAAYGGTGHLIERDSDRYALTEDEKMLFR